MSRGFPVPWRLVGGIALAWVAASCAHRPPVAGTPEGAEAMETAALPALAAAPEPGPLTLGLHDAVLMALEHNAAFRVERLRPGLGRADELLEKAAFDTVLSASAAVGSTTLEGGATEDGAGTREGDTVAGEARLAKAFGSGTLIEAGVTRAEEVLSRPSDRTDREDSWDVTLTQSLLRGLGPGARLARLRQAALDVEISMHELRGAAEALVSQVERVYWDTILAERSIEIHERSLAVATQEVEDVKDRIRVGRVAETELAAAEAGAASRREDLIGARGTLAKRRLELIRVLNLGGGSESWRRSIGLKESPELDAVALDDVEAHVRLAQERRADLCQARLQVRRGDLEAVRTRNGLLPRLDLFVSLGGSRYADSFAEGSDEDAEEAGVTAGVEAQFPLENREARARHARARLSAEQAAVALENMEQLAQVEVRAAYVDVESAAERVKATRATRELREKALVNEQEKFRVGRSTTFLVSQARQEAVRSQIAEVEAVIGYRKALLDLYRSDGSILIRRSIEIP